MVPIGTDIVALILARGGSVGIPCKNICKLQGIPLLTRCINTLILSNCFTSVWVSTDDNAIENVAVKAGARVHRRAPYTATNDAPSVIAVQEFLECQAENLVNICLVQCTSPFLKKSYLIEGLERIKSGHFDSVFTAVRSHSLRWSDSGNNLEPINFLPCARPSRQSWNGELCETGMFYMTSASAVAKTGLLQWGRTGIVEVDPSDSIDIDTPVDLVIAEVLLAQQQIQSNSTDNSFRKLARLYAGLPSQFPNLACPPMSHSLFLPITMLLMQFLLEKPICMSKFLHLGD